MGARTVQLMGISVKNDVNRLSVAGTIINTGTSENGRMYLIIATDGGRSKNSDKIKLIFFDKDMLRNVTIRDRVSIEGHIQPLGNSSDISEWNSRSGYVQEYVVDSIEPQPRALARSFTIPKESIHNGKTAGDRNEVTVCGYFVSCKKFKKDKFGNSVVGITLNVKSVGETPAGCREFQNSLQFVCIGKQAETAMEVEEKRKQGDECRVAITGSIRTDTRGGKNGERTRHLQNIVVEDIFCPLVASS